MDCLRERMEKIGFPMKFTIVYASATGHTEDIAERLDQLLPDSELKELSDLNDIKDIENCEALICCTPTWNTGSDVKRSGTVWDEHIEQIPNLNCAGKPVAIVGLGDSAAFSKFFSPPLKSKKRKSLKEKILKKLLIKSI